MNQYARSLELARLKSEFAAAHGASNIEEYSGVQLDAQTLQTALAGVSLFSANRMVIFKGISENKDIAEKLSDSLCSISDDISVVIVEPQLDKRTVFYKALKKQTDFKEFGDLPEHELAQWVSAQVAEEGGTISHGDAALLAQYCAGDQTRLHNEIQKLVAYEPQISNQTIKLLVEESPQDAIFTLLEQALSQNVPAALRTLQNLEQAHQDPFQIASMLIWQTHILAVVASAQGQSDSEIAKEHKINPYVVSKTRRLALRMNTQTLARVVDQIAQLDITLKSNPADPWRVLEHTVIALK